MTALQSPEANAPRLVPFGRYLLLERIALGGMAEVWLAKRFLDGGGVSELLAIKRILPDLAEDPQFIKMFIDEASIAGQLKHPGIVPIRELGKKNGAYYMVMDYVWGRDLLQILRRSVDNQSMPPVTITAFIGARICEALYFAHTRTDGNGQPLGVVHRDISPQNILISFDGVVRLIDFGIAKAQVRQSKTQVGTLKGKVGYMSPEQVRSNSADHRSDQFTLAICLYEMLTGRPLFVRPTAFETMNLVRDAVVPSLLETAPWVPPTLANIVTRALQLQPENRFPTTKEMQLALADFVRDQEGGNFSHARVATWVRQLFAAELGNEKHHLDMLERIGQRQVTAAVAMPRNSVTELSIPLELPGEESLIHVADSWMSDANNSIAELERQGEGEQGRKAGEIYFDALGKAETVQFDLKEIEALRGKISSSLPPPSTEHDGKSARNTTPGPHAALPATQTAMAPPAATPARAKPSVRPTQLQGAMSVVVGGPVRNLDANTPSGFPSDRQRNAAGALSPTMFPPRKDASDAKTEVKTESKTESKGGGVKATMFFGGHGELQSEKTEVANPMEHGATMMMDPVPTDLSREAAGAGGEPARNAPAMQTFTGAAPDGEPGRNANTVVSDMRLAVSASASSTPAADTYRDGQTIAIAPSALTPQAIDALLPNHAGTVRSDVRGLGPNPSPSNLPANAFTTPAQHQPAQHPHTRLEPTARFASQGNPIARSAPGMLQVSATTLSLLIVGALLLGALLHFAWNEIGAAGVVEVRTQPAHARVFVDGRDRGPAPLRIEGLAPGKHTIMLVAPGRQPLTREIDLGSRGTVLFETTLSREHGPSD